MRYIRAESDAGPSCTIQYVVGRILIPKEPIGEDCLYLNVWTGAKSSNEKRAVIVWIYGGGFASGGAGVPIYDGEAMAKKGIVFVSINYRVGTLWFFCLFRTNEGIW